MNGPRSQAAVSRGPADESLCSKSSHLIAIIDGKLQKSVKHERSSELATDVKPRGNTSKCCYGAYKPRHGCGCIKSEPTNVSRAPENKITYLDMLK